MLDRPKFCACSGIYDCCLRRNTPSLLCAVGRRGSHILSLDGFLTAIETGTLRSLTARLVSENRLIWARTPPVVTLIKPKD